MSARNPSPPPITEAESSVLHSDTIGNTVFSKRWVLQVMFKLSNFVNHSRNTSENNDLDNDNLMKMADDIDDELCKLWDMSMNEEVGSFLQEVDGIDIFLEIILLSPIPRLTEICFGILANMACKHDMCVDISNRENLIKVTLIALGDHNASILVEVTRLLHAVISNDDTRQKWIDIAISHFQVPTHLLYILENSLVDELLLNCTLLMSSIFKHSESLSERFDKERLKKAINDAISQTKDSNDKTKESLLFLQQLIGEGDSERD